MPPRLEGSRLVIASHNQGKVREFRNLLRPWPVSVVAAGELGLSEPEETGASFAANAALKAENAAREARLPALADDSGLAVTSLNGAPGILSARWAGPEKDFARAMALVNSELGDAVDRSAEFVCVLALALPGSPAEVFEGRIRGTLVWPPRGCEGFGYDPMFVADGDTLTFGEIEPAEKHAKSHRARAFTRLVSSCLPPR